MREFLLTAYNEGTQEIVDEYEVEEKAQEIRDSGDLPIAREIHYGEKVIDDVTPHYKKLNANKKRAATIARKKLEADLHDQLSTNWKAS